MVVTITPATVEPSAPPVAPPTLPGQDWPAAASVALRAAGADAAAGAAARARVPPDATAPRRAGAAAGAGGGGGGGTGFCATCSEVATAAGATTAEAVTGTDADTAADATVTELTALLASTYAALASDGPAPPTNGRTITRTAENTAANSVIRFTFVPPYNVAPTPDQVRTCHARPENAPRQAKWGPKPTVMPLNWGRVAWLVRPFAAVFRGLEARRRAVRLTKQSAPCVDCGVRRWSSMQASKRVAL